jgi:hypothetical protein
VARAVTRRPRRRRFQCRGPGPDTGAELLLNRHRLFYTLRYGPVAVCRRNLRYRPGALECYQFIDRVCATPDPLNGWVNSSSPLDAQVFPCPAGIEPPVCRTLDLGQLP